MSAPVEVLRCDNHCLFVAKPAGLPTVPDDSGDESLLDLAREWVRREFSKPGNVFLGVVHRLDRPVSGVVLFARTSKAADRLTRRFAAREARKRYLGVGLGRPRTPAGSVELWLAKDRSRNVVRAVAPGTAGAKRAVTHWRSVAERGGHTLLELRPETGRSHQLRVTAAELGCPLVGDLKYGAREPLDDGRAIALHAERLTVVHPTRDEELVVCLPPPRSAVWRPFAGDFEPEP